MAARVREICTGKAEHREFIQRAREAIRVVVRPDNLGRLMISRLAG